MFICFCDRIRISSRYFKRNITEYTDRIIVSCNCIRSFDLYYERISIRVYIRPDGRICDIVQR